jgi:competence protein CoiA
MSSVCPHSALETEEHRRCKKAIYEALLKQPGVTKVALERSLKSVRPDVSAYVKGVPVAFEVQLSTLSLETIAHRTAEYARKGIYVLWLAQWTPYLDAERYSPRLWEKWVHACYFGRVYYWLHDLTVIPYRFEPHFRAGGSPYAQAGEQDFKRQSKRYRTPVRGEELDLTTDFFPKDRDAWDSPIFKIAPSKLYMDRNPGFLN